MGLFVQLSCNTILAKRVLPCLTLILYYLFLDKKVFLLIRPISMKVIQELKLKSALYNMLFNGNTWPKDRWIRWDKARCDYVRPHDLEKKLLWINFKGEYQWSFIFHLAGFLASTEGRGFYFATYILAESN